MRDFGKLAASGIIGMTPAQRMGHIEYYRTRMQELRDMDQWVRSDMAMARDQISTEIVTLDRMVAMLEQT